MSYHAHATIEIAGRLPAHLLDSLVMSAEADGATIEGDGGETTAAAILDYLANRPGPLPLCNPEAVDGRLGELEDFCLSHDLEHRVDNAAGDGVGAGVTYWRPGMEARSWLEAGQYGAPVVPLDALQEAAAAGPGALAALVAARVAAYGPKHLPPLVIDGDYTPEGGWADDGPATDPLDDAAYRVAVDVLRRLGPRAAAGALTRTEHAEVAAALASARTRLADLLPDATEDERAALFGAHLGA